MASPCPHPAIPKLKRKALLTTGESSKSGSADKVPKL